MLDDLRPRSGEQIAHFKIRSLLGAGGMGNVYLADDTKLHRKVALKILPSVIAADQQARKRLLREAQAAAALDHPHICAIYEVGEDAGQTYIAMQLIEGQTLHARLKDGPIPCLESIRIAEQVADALSEAHAQKITHRDVKPENIMLTRKGQVKVLDFGLAKVTLDADGVDGEAETAALLSTPGLVMGTLPYMSPEQVRGEVLDCRSDIFSLGVVLYEMLCGGRPFTAKSVGETASLILTATPPPLCDANAEVSARLESVVNRCLQKEVSARYQTANELHRDLEGVRSEYQTSSSGIQTVKQPVISSRLDAQPKSRRLRYALILAALSVAIITALLYFLYIRPGVSSVDRAAGAYDYYLRGKVKVSSQTREDNEAAIGLLDQAIENDKNLAVAYAERAYAFAIKASFFAADNDKKKLLEDADVDIARALNLNPNLAEAYIAKGLVLWTHQRGFPHAQAIQSYKRALQLNPNLDEPHHQLAVIYFHIGLFDKATREVNSALEINPGNTLARFRYGTIFEYQGRFEEALRVFKSIPQDANPALVQRNLAGTLFQLGRTEEAERVVDEFLQTYPTDEGGSVTSVKAMLMAKAGNNREAEAAIQHAIEVGKGFGHFHHTAYNIATSYSMMNDRDSAMKWLEEAADDGFPCYPFFEIDPGLNNLRQDPKFIDFMKGLKQQWENYKANL